MTIDELVISLGLDPEDVKSGMEQADKTVSSGMRKIQSTIKSFVAPLAGMFAFGKLFGSYTTEAAQLDRLSESLGIGIERLQEWQGAARSVGADSSVIEKTFRDLNKNISEAVDKGSGSLADFSVKTGLALKDVNGAARSSEDVLLDLADALSGMGKQEATGYAARLGIDPGMVTLLQQGRGALEDLFRQQRELGVYTKQDAEIATKYKRALDDLWQSTKAGSAILLRMIVPAITTVAGWAQKLVSYLRKHEKFVQIFFVAIATAITAYAIPALAKLAVATATNPFALLIAGAAALALVLEDLYVWMNGGEAALGDFWSKFGTPEEVKAKVENFIETLKSIGKVLFNLGKVAVPVFIALASFGKLTKGAKGVTSTVKLAYHGLMLFGNTLTLVGKVITKTVVPAIAKMGLTLIRTVIPAIWSFTAALLANPITGVVAVIAALVAALYLLYKNWDLVKEGAQKLWDGLVSIFSGAVDWFAGIFSAIGAAIIAPFTKAFDKIKNGWNAVKGIFGGGKGDDADAGGGSMPAANMFLSDSAAQSISPASVSNSSNSYNSDTSVSIGKVEISTQATDAEGISRDIGKGLQKNVAKFTVNQANMGVAQ